MVRQQRRGRGSGASAVQRMQDCRGCWRGPTQFQGHDSEVAGEGCANSAPKIFGPPLEMV
jgi:hypothetical protein